MSLFRCKFVNDQVKVQSVLFAFKRFKSKKFTERNVPTKRALNHFDDFYKSVFCEKWPSVRLALLSKPKYVAILNNYGDIERAEENFQNQGAFDLRSFLEVQKNVTQESDRKKSKENEKASLDKVISQQLHSKEEKESEFLHPEGMEFKLKADQIKQAANDTENEEDYLYKPEDARTSLEFDLNRSEIDETRLIMPDSKYLEANLKEFIPATALRGAESFIPESDYYKYYQPKIQTPVSTEEEHELDFPEKLKVYSFDRGDITDFPDPVRNIVGVHDYLKVDGGELLAALALGVQPNDSVLDMCSSSGNIAYCIFQTLRPKLLVCTRDAMGNIKDLFNEHLLDFSQSGDSVLHVTSTSVEMLETDYLFDKVLVNVPSTEDRSALFEDDNNIFHIMNTKRRLTLPEYQCELLIQGLKLARPGGTVLYTSSTLSPIQNDGVVNQALKALWEDSRQDFIVKDLTPALQHTSSFFNYGNYLNLKFGTLLVPFLPVNFGPRYICKIVKKGEASTSTVSPDP